MRLAAWDGSAVLGMWDLDEFLVLPRQATWRDIMGTGCLGASLSVNPEVTVNVTWVTQQHKAPDLPLWLEAGSWHEAVHRLPYRSIPYQRCLGACKSFITPSASFSYGVHGSIAQEGQSQLLPWGCARLLHFLSLWVERQPSHNHGTGSWELDKSAVPLTETCRTRIHSHLQ
jgi:hypothetical protein